MRITFSIFKFSCITSYFHPCRCSIVPLIIIIKFSTIFIMPFPSINLTCICFSKSNRYILTWGSFCCCCKCRTSWQCTKYTKCCYSTAYYKRSNTTTNTISRSSTLFSVTMGKFWYNDILIFYLAPYDFVNLIHKFTLPFK